MADRQPSYSRFDTEASPASTGRPVLFLAVYPDFDRWLTSEHVPPNARWPHRFVACCLLRALRQRHGHDDVSCLDDETVRLAWTLQEPSQMAWGVFLTTARFFLSWLHRVGIVTHADC